MTGQDMYNFYTGTITNNLDLDINAFLTLAVLAQGVIEQESDWAVLRAQNISQIASKGDNYKSAKTLASDFSRWRSERPIVLYQMGNTEQFLDNYEEVPLEYAISYQDDYARFYVDYANFQLFLCGGVDQTYIIQQNYILDNAPITAGTQWLHFPAKFHAIIPYYVAALFRSGIDYDENNARMAVGNDSTVQEMLSAMKRWNASLQVGSLRGLSRGRSNGYPIYGGRVPMDDYNG
jgi:hypothetical protein